MAKRTQKETQFKPDGAEALSRKVIGVKVSIEVEEALSQLSPGERSKWLRKVITDAAKIEFMKQSAA